MGATSMHMSVWPFNRAWVAYQGPSPQSRLTLLPSSAAIIWRYLSAGSLSSTPVMPWLALRWTCAGDLSCCHTHATPEVGISPLPPPPANSYILSAGPSTARYSELWSSALWPLTNLHFSRHPLQKQTNKQKPPVNKQDLLRPKLRAMKICTCKHTCLECTLTAWLFSEIMTVFHTSTPSQGLCFA